MLPSQPTTLSKFPGEPRKNEDFSYTNAYSVFKSPGETLLKLDNSEKDQLNFPWNMSEGKITLKVYLNENMRILTEFILIYSLCYH